MNVLEEVLRVAGVVLAVGGAVISVPTGTMRLWRRITRALGRVWKVILDLLPFLARKGEAIVIAPPGIASFSALGGVEVSGVRWSPDADAETRISELKTMIDNLDEKLSRRSERHDKRFEDLETSIRRVAASLAESHQNVIALIGENDVKSAAVAAEGLPVIAAGIFLSGIPQELTIIPWVGWTFLAAAVAISTVCAIRSVQSGAWSDEAES